jgi:predicted transcriptional regulator
MSSDLVVILPPVAVSPETAEALQAIAEADERTMSWVIRQAVEHYVAA